MCNKLWGFPLRNEYAKFYVKIQKYTTLIKIKQELKSKWKHFYALLCKYMWNSANIQLWKMNAIMGYAQIYVKNVKLSCIIILQGYAK